MDQKLYREGTEQGKASDVTWNAARPRHGNLPSKPQGDQGLFVLQDEPVGEVEEEVYPYCANKRRGWASETPCPQI